MFYLKDLGVFKYPDVHIFQTPYFVQMFKCSASRCLDVDNLVSDPHNDVRQLLERERFQADALQIHEQAQVLPE